MDSQGANSKMVYYSKHVVKTVLDDEAEPVLLTNKTVVEQPLNIAAAREVYLMQLGKTKYERIPEFYCLTGNSITMERIQGTQLGEFMKQYGSKKNYRSITDSVSQALKQILSAGVVHKDLSYENIMIDNNGEVWIVDFGRARLIGIDDGIKQLYDDEMFIYFDTLNDFLEYHHKSHIIPRRYVIKK